MLRIRICMGLGPALALALVIGGCGQKKDEAAPGERSGEGIISGKAALACARLVGGGFLPIAEERDKRFLGKVSEDAARCRGGEKAVSYRDTPWVDWANYWATGDEGSRSRDFSDVIQHLDRNGRGVDGALIDLEYARVELIKFNLFDNYTWPTYVRDGRAAKVWPEMRLEADHKDFAAVGGAGEQVCSGDLIRYRTLTGVCNDIRNPRMGSSGTLFARNTQFETQFPELGLNELVRNRHGDRLGLLKPDPQVISRKLFTRVQTQPGLCNDGLGIADGDPQAHCDYKKAPFFNVLAAFWIQFMTHDWFSHLNEGHNSARMMNLGCDSQKVAGAETPLSPDDVSALGCRPDDRMEASYVAQDGAPGTFRFGDGEYLSRAHKTFENTVTAWWDASQIYGYDETSRKRVRRADGDRAKLAMVQVGSRAGAGEAQGYLPLFEDCAGAGAACTPDPINPAWAGQEATAFPDNFTIGMSFYHNVFAREHNAFVDAFRELATRSPEADSGLRNPANPRAPISYAAVSADELFEVARLVVAMEIAKIHTIEWTTQLLYGEPLYRGMNGNWGGLFDDKQRLDEILGRIVSRLGEGDSAAATGKWYSVFAAGPGIVGLGSKRFASDTSIFRHLTGRAEDIWDMANPDHVNGGVNHFGSPFNFPEEFVTVYRLHPLVPDLIEFRDWQQPGAIARKLPVVASFRGKASAAMRDHGLAGWALSMGRQRLGTLSLQNHARFLQNLEMKRLNTPTQRVDVAALDLIRDRERGIPRFNEFRRQYGLRQLTSFDDFIDRRLAEDSPERNEQARLAGLLREVYGQHVCSAGKVITRAQLNTDGSPIDDCLGHPDGTAVDNVEDLDTVVGWLAESTRPHGYAISETQFVVFILNASRRLFSDRFFTSSFRPEFYSSLGYHWVMNNGPGEKLFEKGEPNGHRQPVSPMKRVLQRTLPELAAELDSVVNVFDPWARDRGEYYSLEWKPRPGAEDDVAFAQP